MVLTGGNNMSLRHLNSVQSNRATIALAHTMISYSSLSPLCRVGFQETEERKATRDWIFQKSPLTDWEIVGYEKAKALRTLSLSISFRGPRTRIPANHLLGIEREG